MVEKNSAAYPKLWISYPWVEREERDFGYLVKQLETKNFETVYNSMKIMQDKRLSQRIVQRLQSIGFDGWLYVLTHQCITRREYTDELTSAIDQTILHMGPRFPIAGLMYGIASNHVPPRLRILPCISLGDPEWNLQVCKIFNKNKSSDPKPRIRKESRFVWKLHPCYGGNPSITAIEVRSRGEALEDWRFAIPKSCHPIRWGQGNSGGGELSKVRFGEVTGTGRYENNEVYWFGASNTVSITESAYVLFAGTLPDFICFGPASNSRGVPGKMEIFWPHREIKSVCQNDTGNSRPS
ncbi:MAG: hypothetical protein JXR49_04045 [Acidobacteria bacterium]|nr:hypothetical protein [Acidobacteriota bacterium]